MMDFDLNKIDALIIDLGGVILDIDIKGPFEKFRKLGIGSGQDGIEAIKENDIFLRFEKGQLTPEEFRDEIRKTSTSEFSNKEFDDIWNGIIQFYPADRISALEKLRIKYRTFLMSNTNEIHFHSYSKMLSENFGYEYLDELFEKAYYSHTSGMRKPDAEFFEHILNENNLQPEKTLFVDDFIENIEAAKALKINAYHIYNGHSLVDLLY